MMFIDLNQIQNEIAEVAIASPYPYELATAIVSDCFRMAGKAPLPDGTWATWRKKKPVLFVEQVGILAHILASTSLRQAAVDSLRALPDPSQGLEEFFSTIEPLTAEMVRSNKFRQEEFLRRFAGFCKASIAGESEEVSKSRMAQLDYRKTLAEYQRAKQVREDEKKKREALLREAEEKEAAARGWRE